MFKGKVTIIKNVNGKEEKVEKEFKSPEEYAKFVSENFGGGFSEPRLTLSEWGSLGSMIDQIFENRLSSFFLDNTEDDLETVTHLITGN